VKNKVEARLKQHLILCSTNMELTTKVFLIGTILVWILYDIFALYMSKKTEYTISYVIGKIGVKYPLIQIIILLSLGILIGHFFWHQCII
jgi:hypothetical protein